MERGVDRSPTELIPLTAREREVAELIADGLTNAEIAERLNLTFATSKWHVSQVLSKLEVDHREAVGPRLAAIRQHPAKRPGRQFSFGTLLSLKALGAASAAVPVAGMVVFGAAVFSTAENGQSPPAPRSNEHVTATSTSSPLVQKGFDTVAEARAALIPADPDCSRDPGWAPHANFATCDFSGYFFGAAMLNGSTFEGANLKGANLSLATIAGANFTGADLRDAAIRDAITQGADFSGANLTGAEFFNTIVEGAIWDGAICPDGTPSTDYGGTCVGSPGLEDPPTTRALIPPPAAGEETPTSPVPAAP